MQTQRKCASRAFSPLARFQSCLRQIPLEPARQLRSANKRTQLLTSRMTRHDIISLGQTRRGAKNWIGPFADELGYSFSQPWRIVNGEAPVSRRMQLEIERIGETRLPSGGV